MQIRERGIDEAVDGLDAKQRRRRFPAIGSHLMVRRKLGYAHHGVYIGKGNVVHFSGEPGRRRGKMEMPTILISRIEEFLGQESELRLIQYADTQLSRDVIVARAKSRVGEASYHLFLNNREHFASWCCTGSKKSVQVRSILVGGILHLVRMNRRAGEVHEW